MCHVNTTVKNKILICINYHSEFKGFYLRESQDIKSNMLFNTIDVKDESSSELTSQAWYFVVWPAGIVVKISI